MISLEEFMTATEDKEFKKNEEWKVADLKF